jgi:hypothetical protein
MKPMPNRATSYGPKFYRERAEEMRSVAELMSSEDAKQKMLGVARSYERLAEQAEGAHDGASGKSK